MTKDELVQIRKDINAALAAVGKKHGMKLDIGNIRYSDSSFTTKLTGAKNTGSASVDSDVNAKYIRNFEKNCVWWKMQRSDLGRTFTLAGNEYTLVGGRALSAKVQLVAKCKKTGGLVVVTVNDVRNALVKAA